MQYVLSELLGRRMGAEFSIETDAGLFIQTEADVKINYTKESFSGCLQIIPNGLLSEAGLRDMPVQIHQDDKWHSIFWNKTNNEVPFDVFSAAFYLLSRYEEYVKPMRDAHGRFEAKSSLAFQHGFLQVPLIELWVYELKKVLKQHNNTLKFTMHIFSVQATIDVDFAYMYKGIGIKRWMGKFVRNLVTLNLKKSLNQVGVSSRIQKDPYDTYEFIRETTTGPLGYFMLMNNNGGYDKASDPRSLKSLTGKLKEQADFIGIHPSYQSNIEHNYLATELEALKKLTGENAKHSRIHFLKLTLPESYRRLYDAGIRHDYTMLYADATGFRASTCFPFYFYDLLKEEQTQLYIHSTCIMDVTLKNYLKLSKANAKQMIRELKDQCRRYGGNFIVLWHNSSLSEYEGWAGWQDVYASIFNNTKEQS